MKRLTSLILVSLSALAVAACGLRGDLERPPPLWGNPEQASQDDAEDNEGADSER